MSFWKQVFKTYKIRLRDRHEVVEYRDGIDTYWFVVSFVEGQWILYLPGSRGKKEAIHELDIEERERVIPRVTSYLSNFKFVFEAGGPYPVSLERLKDSGDLPSS